MNVLTLPGTPPCAADPEVFFEPDEETATHRRYRETQALAICARCPFRLACLEYALTEKFDYGIFGGLTVPGRLAVARRRRDKRFRDRLRERKAAA